MITTASLFLKALADAGVTHAFVNWGNDHSSILEDLERQRVELGKTLIEIVTCPNEMVALSAAQGYAQVTGKPALVIVHVDVGTQALAGAIHNVDKGQTPVIIFAGAAPFSASGEVRGSKNEWPMWGQDVPDQPAIVRQYMRYTAQIMSGRTVAKTVMRAWQFTMSAPTGPVYLWARRETMEEEVDPALMNDSLDLTKWPPVQPCALTDFAIATIVDALSNATFPLIIASRSGRNPRTVPLLTVLSDLRSIAIFTSFSHSICVPYDHPRLIGGTYDGTKHYVHEADVVLIIDTEVPWIEAKGSKLKDSARVFVIDPDPLKQNYGFSHVDTELLCKADTEIALQQLVQAIRQQDASADGENIRHRVLERGEKVAQMHAGWKNELSAAEVTSDVAGGTLTASVVLGAMRNAVQALTSSRGENVLWINEAISNYGKVYDHIQPKHPGSMLMSGGSSLGWALGAAVGARLGAQVIDKNYEMVATVVGDGTFLFGVPSAAYWMARRYNTPHLTVILNNGGWASPKYSMLGMHPQGLGSKASAQKLTVAFSPEMPDYALIAAGAGGAWGRRVSTVAEIRAALEGAIRVVLQERRSAILDCLIEQI